MSDHLLTVRGDLGGDEPLLDTLLREAVPEIKLALGDLIDRDNARAIPDRYTKLLPETTLVVTLRPDAARALYPVAAELEGELTDSVMRHGSLYDREYRVKLKEAAAPTAPLFRVSMTKGDDAGLSLSEMPPPPPPPPPPAPRPAPRAPEPDAATVAAPLPRAETPAHEATVAEPPPVIHVSGPSAPSAPPVPSAPSEDPDATRIDGVAAPPAAPAPEPEPEAPPKPRWDVERFALVVESEEGEERERFPVPAPMTTVGRQTEKSETTSDVAITNAPHVSRRQLAMVWAPRGERPGFTVYNLGLNPLHVGGREVPGANRKGELDLGALMDHSEWVAPGTAMRIGEHGPVLRIVEVGGGEEAGAPAAEVEEDPDATQFG